MQEGEEKNNSNESTKVPNALGFIRHKPHLHVLKSKIKQRREKEEEKGEREKEKKGTSAQTRMTLEGQGIVQWWVHEKRAQRRRGELLPDACC